MIDFNFQSTRLPMLKVILFCMLEELFPQIILNSLPSLPQLI